MKRTLIVLLALIVVGCRKPPPEKDPLVDGDFELPKATASMMTFMPGQSIGPWEVHEAPVEVVADAWKAAHGSQSIHLPAHSWIARNVPTTPGQMYTLSFSLSGNPDGAQDDKKLEIWWGDQLLETIAFHVGNNSHELFWKPISFNVVAKEKSTRIRFVAGNESAGGPLLDNVKVTVLKQ